MTGRPSPGASLRGPAVAATASVFVGRDNERDAVVRALADPLALVLIEGEPGIGKTRLLHEALTTTPDRVVLVAACPPLREPFPLGPVVAGLRQLWQQAGGVALSPLGGALRPLFPEWADDLPPALEAFDDPRETRLRIFRALTELVDRLAVGALVVEDAHWADTATLEWLLTLMTAESAAGGRKRPAVVTYRPHDVPAGSPLLRLTSRPLAGTSRVRLTLEPLDAEQTSRMVGSMFGDEAVSEEITTFLYERTDGVPLAVEECVRLLRDRRDVVQRGGQWNRRLLEELRVPATLRDSVLERVERFTCDARAVLEAAAALAAPADEQLLATVAGLHEDAGRAALAELWASGLVQEADPGRFRFRHLLDAQAVEEAIPAPEWRRLHGRAAAALQQLDPQPVVRLAHHFREAGDTEAWCGYAEASADLALESGDDRAAVVALLDLLTSIGHPAPRRTRLAVRLGEAACSGLAALGDLADRVVATLRGVLTLADVPSRERGEIRLLLGRLLRVVGAEQAAFEQFETAIPDLDDRPDLAVYAMMALALPVTPDWPGERHREWLERATALLPRVEAPLDRLSFQVTRVTALLFLGDEAGWQGAAELPRSASRRAEQRLIVHGLVNVAQAAIMWGFQDIARERLAAARELIEVADYRRLESTARVAELHLDWYTGAWEALAERAEALAGDDEITALSRLEARQLQGLIGLIRGDRAAAEQHLRRVSDEYARSGAAEYLPLVAAALGRLRLSEGEIGCALRETGPVVEMISRKGSWATAADIAPVHMDGLVTQGRLNEGRRLLAQFAARLDGRDAPAPAAALLQCRALLAQAGGDRARAATLFAEAAAAWAELPRPYDELLARERQGACLLASGAKDNALALLSDVQERLWELGARGDADRVAQLLRAHGVMVSRTWRRGRRGYGDRLSPREREVAELVANGMTNKQIADTLFISPATVKRHLTASMRKLAVSSRTALAIAVSDIRPGGD